MGGGVGMGKEETEEGMGRKKRRLVGDESRNGGC